MVQSHFLDLPTSFRYKIRAHDNMTLSDLNSRGASLQALGASRRSMMRFWIATVALTSVICIAATPIPAQAQNAASGVPRLMQVPGQVLTPAGDARTGNVLLTFAIYQDQTGGTPLW